MVDRDKSIAENKGYIAFYEGAEQTDNPYKEHSVCARLWLAGWLAAHQDCTRECARMEASG